MNLATKNRRRIIKRGIKIKLPNKISHKIFGLFFKNFNFIPKNFPTQQKVTNFPILSHKKSHFRKKERLSLAKSSPAPPRKSTPEEKNNQKSSLAHQFYQPSKKVNI